MHKFIQHPHFPTLALLLAVLLAMNSLRWIGTAWESYQQYAGSQQRLRSLANARETLQTQQLEIKQLELGAQRIQSATVTLKDHLDFVSYLEGVCKERRVQILTHPQESTQQMGAYTLSDERFSLQAPLPALLKTLYQLEYQDRIGSIAYASLELEVVGFGRARKQVLVMQLGLKRM